MSSSTPQPNPHFKSATSWKEAAALVHFEPVVPQWTDGQKAQSFAVHVMDHKRRELDIGERSLEAYFGTFSMSQALKADGEARRWAIETRYGTDAREVTVAGHEGRAYALGPEPEPDDIDPRMPAIVTWYVDDRFFMLASDQLEVDVLTRIAESCYPA